MRSGNIVVPITRCVLISMNILSYDILIFTKLAQIPIRFRWLFSSHSSPTAQAKAKNSVTVKSFETRRLLTHYDVLNEPLLLGVI